MKSVTAADAKARFGRLLDQVQSEPVMIEKHGRGVAVMLSREEFNQVREAKLALLRSEIQAGLADLEAGRIHVLDETNEQEFFDAIKQEGRNSDPVA